MINVDWKHYLQSKTILGMRYFGDRKARLGWFILKKLSDQAPPNKFDYIIVNALNKWVT